jgi:hypothetical protein
MTEEEKSTNYDTFRHIERVRNLLNRCVVELINRGELHDQSKMASPEVEFFTKYTKLLANCEYNSEEYRKNLAEMKPALDHHYANNRHHPEHHKNGINDMNLIDLIELLCDWKASSERQNNGNIRKSIEMNANRFNMSQQLVRIFENTVDLL